MTWCALVFAIATFMCGASNSLEELIGWRILQGAAGAPLVPLGQTILLDSFPRRQHGFGHFDLRHGQHDRSLHRADVRRPDRRVAGLALGLLDGAAGRRRLGPRQLAGAAARRQAARGPSRLAGLPQSLGRHRGGAARVLARAEARLVRQRRDRDRDAGGRSRALHFLRPQPDQRAAVRAPEPARRPQLQPRPDPGDAVRHAQLRHRGADAAAAAAARGLSRFRHRRDRRLSRHGIGHRVPAGDTHGAPRPAHEPGARRADPGQHAAYG